MSQTQAPAWDIESEYPSLDSPEFRTEEENLLRLLHEMEDGVKALGLDSATTAPTEAMQAILLKEEEAGILLGNLYTYTSCLLSVDAGNEKARAKSSHFDVLGARLGQIIAPLRIFLQRAPEEIFRAVLAHSHLKPYEFLYRQERSLAPHLLSPQEEVLIRALEVPGHKAWGTLYEELTGKGKCRLDFGDRSETLGIAEASALLYGPDAKKRQAAWHALQTYWTDHRDSAAAVANALAGWRLELCRKRSHTKPMHFLDRPLYENRITRETLEAIMACCQRNIEQLRRAPRLMARVMKKDRLDPWDLLGPSPVTGAQPTRSFAEGARIVREAFHGVDPEFGRFLDLMLEKRWVEARVLPTKAGGAHCTGFPKSLTPRVFQTYMGSLPDISTLAHEVGHAFHSWVMRDLSRGEQHYPMTLAETASVFAETALRESLAAQAQSREEKIEFGWTDLESITGFLINIPVRFDYEKSFYERRAESTVSADEMSELMDAAWTKWYGPTVSRNDRMFWASKQHFSFAEVSFYNFPYTFGYLFSLSVYARRKALGGAFMETYKNILRDTGRMTAEDLVQKHLGEDIRQPAFWQKAVDIEIAKIDRFEAIGV
jgi:oligoendopeptidase F